MHSFQERLATLSEILQDTAGQDALLDRYHCGYIAAIKDLLNIEVEESLE